MSKNQKLLENAIDKVLSGNGILFAGAGFSKNALNIENKELPLANELAKKISKLIPDFTEDTDLTYVSEFFIKKEYDTHKLTELLKKEFTVKSVSESHKTICKLNWKRIYTTNYDNSIKLAYTENDKHLQVVSAYDEKMNKFSKQKNVCVHINGEINDLTDENLDDTFKLTETSYMSSDSFMKTFWYRQFKYDLDKAGAIIFIGYSLYDFEIKKLLFDNEEYRKKTFFIVSENSSPKNIFKLEQYGNVYTLGIDGIASLFNKKISDFKPIDNEFFTEAFEQYILNNNANEILDKNITEFFQYGVLDEGFIYNAILTQQNKPYLIVREQLNEIKSLLDEYQYIFVVSDFGNGKTVFLKELMSDLIINNKKAFYLKDFNANYFSDIEKIDNLGEDIYIIVDGYAKCLDIFEFIKEREYKNLKFIFSERSTIHLGLKNDILRNLNSVEVSLDQLNNEEIESFINIIDNTGYWGEKSKLSFTKKKELIRQNNSEISVNLLDLFDSVHIKEKLKSIVDSINNSEYKNTLFAICLLEALDVDLEQNIISEVALSNAIYESKFKENKEILQFFKFNGNHINSKSSLYSLYLLQNAFTANYIIERLILISEKFNLIKDESYVNKSIFKYLLRFNFIQRILPRKGQKNGLIQYYEKLKDNIPWLKSNIHYWLQYGMCRIALEEYEIAQKYLETAYSYASLRDEYDTDYIDSQQSRLYLIQALKEHISQVSFVFFEKAHNLIMALPNDGYKFKRIKDYHEIFEKHYTGFSKANKEKFLRACESLLTTVRDIYRDKSYESYSFNRVYDTSQEYLEDILLRAKK